MAKGAKTGGRKRGTPNKLTTSVKDALSKAFDGVGGLEELEIWGKANRGEFYKLWAKMLPTDVKLDGDVRLGVVVLPPVSK